MKHTEIRKKYLDFFKSKDHTVISSDSLVPADDPTLLFTSAGMNQFKDQFLGKIKGYTKATSCQKCLRTPDLENVGRTAYHHTFFEMLGNFSFGDYFKKEAIEWAWEFLIDVLKIPNEKLWVSVYEEDDEAYGIWKEKIGVPEQRIVRLGQKDNFWPSEAKDKGPNGPCGPCSEIFYDYGKDTGCKKEDCTPACSCGRFVEVWNLVFTQYERKDGGKLDPLPNKNIDTGMGLERLTAVLQGVFSNFQTDIFAPIIGAIKDALHDVDSDLQKTDLYAIADHVRAVSFAISDGVAPSNEERGYVIRNVLRKASMHCRNLGIEGPFLYKLVYEVGKAMEEPYPEILKRHQHIAEVMKFEEERFANTLKEGLRLLEDIISKVKESGSNKIDGITAFKLFDTHGLPMVIIKEAAAKEDMLVDEDQFEKCMEEQRELSRKTSKMNESVFVDSGIDEKTEFIGYDNIKAQVKVVRILTKDGKDIRSAKPEDDIVEVILDKSVFYGESGGQVGDTGTISGKGLKASVIDARRLQDAILLDTQISEGEIKVDDIVEAAIDAERRLAIAKNHTATHLLQSALRAVLGEHVQQQGSFVAEDRLRFDFTHFKALTEDEIERVEELVNRSIEEALPISKKKMKIDEAKSEGALAFFGEKYDQEVRVVSAGEKSKELCGGTHLDNAKEIQLFKIMREGSVASGIRRIEAVTAQKALEWSKEKEKATAKEETALKEKEKSKQLAKERLNQVGEHVDSILESAKEVSGAKLMIVSLDGIAMDGLKKISDIIRTQTDQFIFFALSVVGDRASTLLSLSDRLVDKGLDAGNLMKEIAKSTGASGGGRPNMAQGGLKDIEKIDLLMKEAEAILSKAL